MSDTARNKAIDAILDVPPTRLGVLTAAGGARLLAGALLDAVPDQVLADLLIERGALTQIFAIDYETWPTKGEPLYRLTPKDPDHE
jgi:hypothetical protein